MRTELCRKKTSKVKVTVWAEIAGEWLTIIGHEVGNGVIEQWGREERHYSYAFDPLNTKRLYNVLSKSEDESSLLPLLVKFFSGMHACTSLDEVCETSDIEYAFSSW